jgi:hypothetical protein
MKMRTATAILTAFLEEGAMRASCLVVAATVAGCTQRENSETYTLYRNSPYAVLRVHWATFDVKEGAGDLGANRDNCEMAARILNANVAAGRKQTAQQGQSEVGFWCERGRYAEHGGIPAHFESQFPSDVGAASSVSQ